MGCVCFKASATQDDISLLRGLDPTLDLGDDLFPPPPYDAQHERRVVFHPGMDLSQPVLQLTEDDQIRIAKRIGLINHLPCGTYDCNKKTRECAICMSEFVIGDKVRYLPCMHTYHCDCIDDWLIRSLTCPSCMEPVDAALLTSYDVNNY